MKPFLRLLTLHLLLFNFSSYAQQLTSIESAEFDAVNHRFLISNGNSVVVVDNTGNEIENFGTDPEADYGMEIMNDVLYAIVGSSVKGYDLTSGAEVTSINISGASFLNGMASDGDHRVWVTDFNGHKIYEIDFSVLSNPSFVQVVDDTGSQPNGIVYDEDDSRLVFVSWGSGPIKAVALPGYEMTTLLGDAGVSNVDGIDNDEYGNFYISSWTPNRIIRFNNDFTMDEMITVTGLSSPADIAYAEEIDTLIIPNSANQTVKFVGFAPVSVAATSDNPIAFSCYPNPVTDKSVLEFRLDQGAFIRISILDSQGRPIETIFEEHLPAASHKIVPGELDLPAGNYFWHISTGDVTITLPFVK